MSVAIEQMREALLAAAREARRYAYAPYSGFAVGAAVCSMDGRVFTGANVENASYGLTICAERVALYRAIMEGARTIVGLAVATRDGSTPCGACRQVLAEFAGEEMSVWCVDDEGEVQHFFLSQLLPVAFRLAPSSSPEEEIALGGI